MSLADWFLSRSEAFRLLMMKFRDHKQDTVEAFSRVKKKHLDYDRRLDSHAGQLKQLQEILNLLHEKVTGDKTSAIIKVARKKR